MKIKEIILRGFAIMLIAGGILRVLATQTVFYKMRVGYFWIEDDYYKFVNKILGAFLILCGFLFWGVARDIVRFRFVMGSFGWGIFIFGAVIAVSGYLMGLQIWSWAPDAILMTVTALFCAYIKAQ
tara:strand:+ start:460 stop:837 length:378 start_codon:yes stop_codon:yes gene_type:complete